MSRGKQKTTEQKLDVVNSEITEMEDRKSKIEVTLKKLYDERDELQNKIKLEQASDLLDIIKASGKTPEEVAAMLKSSSEESA